MDRLCTYFDEHYLARGLALHASLVRHWPDFELWVLCLDDVTAEVLGRMALPRVRLVRLGALERHDPALPAARGSRSRLGYYFTTTPIVARYVFDRAPDAMAVFYLDADLFFFSSPAPIHDEMRAGSVLIHKHGIAKTGHRHGTFNVGLVGFRRDEQGLACLDLWRQRCLAWCDAGEGPGGEFGDQKYLDEWPARFSRVVVARGAGIGFAPWNLTERTLTVGDDGAPLVDGDPLVFFHFQGLRGIGPRALGAAVAHFPRPMARTARNYVYRPYVRAVDEAARRARRFGAARATAFGMGIRARGDAGVGNGADGDGRRDGGRKVYGAPPAARFPRLDAVADRARSLPEFVRRARRGQLLVVARGRAF